MQVLANTSLTSVTMSPEAREKFKAILESKKTLGIWKKKLQNLAFQDSYPFFAGKANENVTVMKGRV